MAAETPAIPAAMLEILEVEVPLFQEPGPAIKLLHLSDLHASDYVRLEYLSSAIELALKTKPDVICVTGDFVTSRFDRLEEYAALLKRLPAAAPTFACLGNHDGGAWSKDHGGFETTRQIRHLLELAGVVLLQNTAVIREINGRSLRLVGVGDIWAGECQPKAAFAVEVGQSPAATLILAHNPDSKDSLRGYCWDLMLSGHTHGGEIEMPFLGEPFAPVMDKRYVRGLHSWEQHWLHVSKGVGSLYGLRVNCPGDATLLKLSPRLQEVRQP